MNDNRRFYWVSIAALLILSAYPLLNGVRMAFFSITQGTLEPEQYAAYVIPYAAICVSLLWFAVMQPVFFRMKRLAFHIGLITAFGVFFAVELFFESMQIHTSGMTLIDTAALSPDGANAAATVDLWQAALCIVSPYTRGQSLTYAYRDSFFYVIGNNAYKIHYYIISLILITMVSGLIFGIAKMLRDNEQTQLKTILLRGISTVALIALCVFANTTAFFRQAADIQTPLASALTAIFFVILGTSTGVYFGSYLLNKGKRFGIGAPVLLSLCITILMYIGEAVMMSGNLYRFGRGWFFEGLQGITLAPVDILIILLSGAVTWLVLSATRKREKWPGKRTIIVAAAICVAAAAIGPVIAAFAPKITDDITGCYLFDKNLYTNPLSSFWAYGGLPYVYGFDEDVFIIADTESGDIRSYNIEYCRTPVGADEFTSKAELLPELLPELTGYKERYLLAVMTDGNGSEFGLYRMDGELWLTELRGIGIWCIYRIKQTDTTTLQDLELAAYQGYCTQYSQA